MDNLNLPVTKVHFEFLEDCPGEIIFKSNGFGQFCLSEKIFLNTAPSNQFPMTMFEDPLLLVKKIKNPCVINQNVIFCENGRLVADSGYHIVPPPVDPRKFGMDVNRIISAAADVENDIKYLVSDNTQKKSTGFYLGDTDNFGHWLFEFLPKVLWYKRLFPNHDLPLIIGESVPEKWLEFLEPFGIEKKTIERFPSGATVCFDELILCTAPCRRVISPGLKSTPIAMRLNDFYEIRALVENHFNHIKYQGEMIDCLFCTRKNARWRKTTNEDEVVSWLSEKFSVVELFEPENLSIKEQFNILGRTKFFFTTGASIPFCMFSPIDSVAFQIRPPEGDGTLGKCWAQMFKFGHHRVATAYNPKDVGLANFHERDLVINMEQFVHDVTKIAEVTELVRKKGDK